MAEKVYIISHTDLDGYFSGGLVQYYHKKFINPDAVFIHKSWTYSRELPQLSRIKKMYTTVYVVDLVLPAEAMLFLYENYKDNFVWIDHHITPDNNFYKEFSVFHPRECINGLRAEEEHSASAVLLTYMYFQQKYEPERKDKLIAAPEWIKLLSDYDCWNRTNETRWQNEIMPLFSYLKGEISNPAAAYMYCLNRSQNGVFYDSADAIKNKQTDKEISTGLLLYKAIKSIYNAEAKHGFQRQLHVIQGNNCRILKAWVCNTQNRSSIIFEDLPKRSEYDVFIPYHFNGKQYLYSMYTFKNDISCNQITVVDSNYENPVLSFQGHQDAAGATSENFMLT